MISFARKCLLAVLVAGPVCSMGESFDWPNFHGVARDNVSKETGLLKEWPAGGPKLAWQEKKLGDGYSSVAIAGGRIYTAGTDGDTTVVIALNEADGKEVWRAKVGNNWKKDQGGSGPRATPTVDGTGVYFISPVGDVVALAAADGKEMWRVNVQKEFGGRPPQWGYSESVLVEGDNVVCTPGGAGGTVVALNKATGKTAWRSKDLTDAAAYAPPLIAEIGGVRQIITYTEQHVAGIDPKDGSVLWSAPRQGNVATIPTPVVKDNYVYVTSGYGIGCDLFKVENQGGKFTVTPVYTKNKTMVNHHGGVILLDGNLYGYSDGKGWVCQDLVTGEAKWKNKEALGKGTISYADGRFYLWDEKSHTVALIEASPEAYKEKGRFTPPEKSSMPAWAHLVISNGKLYVRDQDNLFCYDVKGK